MNRRASLGVLASGVFVFISVGLAQTTANPNPSTLPVPTQTNPAGTGGSNTTTPPPDPTPPASTAPAPPAKQTAPPAPQNQQTAPSTNPAVEQTSPTGNNAIKNQPTQPSANPGSTNPGAAESSPAGGMGALNAGGLTSDQLHQRIDAALHSEPTLSGSNLTVNVSDDSIDLSGTVSSSKDRLTAHRIVQSFAGNRRVRERVTVAGGSPRSSTPNATKDQIAAPTTEKSEVEKANRPITDPAKHGDASDDPRRL
jgi:hypothetical protein